MRSGVIAILISLTSLVFWKNRKIAMPYLITLFLIIILAIPLIPKTHWERYLSLKHVNDLSLTGRISIWQGAVEQIKSSPFWGDTTWHEPISNDVHNSIFFTWIRFGFILGFVYQLYFFVLLMYAVKNNDIWTFTIFFMLQSMNMVETLVAIAWCTGYFHYIAGVSLANRYIPMISEEKNKNLA
jgi:hypothetical protein